MDGSDSSEEEDSDFKANFNISERDLEEEAEGFAGHRKRRKFTKEDAMLGIWAEDDDDNSNAPSPAQSSRPKFSSGINFTPSRVDSPVSRPQSPQSRNESPEPTGRPGLGGPQLSARNSSFRQASATPPPVHREFAKFASHGTGFGLKMLQKMGWQMGKGLGAEGEGIINPIETKQRPTRMGIAFKGFDERTKQHKEEAARRGEVVSDEEMEETTPAKSKKRRDAWKKDVLVPSAEKANEPSKPRKPKVVYKTASEIISESAIAQPVAQKIIDMTGPAAREISSLAQIRSQSPTMMEVSTRLPELRHNLRLIADLSLSDLDHLTREKRLTEVREQNLEQEREQLQQRIESDDNEVKRVDELQRIGREIEAISKSALATGAFEQGDITALFGEHFTLLETRYAEEYKAFGLDALVVSVWAPILKYGCVRWDVLSQPSWSADLVSRWRRLLLCNDDTSRNNDSMDVDSGFSGRQRNGRRGPGSESTLLMTPFESMMFTIWLPKVRSAINNTWNPREPEPIIQLLEAWTPPVLPLFIYENIIDQLILPKLSKAVSDWDPRNDPVQIHTWIHPWLPTLKAWRLSGIFTSIRQKLAVVLRQWHPSDESALHILQPWKDVWDANPMEKLIIKSILPKLTQVMRTEFMVNPREQNLEPFVWCLAWKDIISPVLIGQLLENEFFPKWLDVLYKWVTLDPKTINWDEVSQWYSWWKQVFSSYDIEDNPLVKASFRKGLELMHRASSGERVENPAVAANS